MRRPVLGMSMVAVVLWAAAGVLAQGQGKEQGGGGKERVRERPARQAKENAPAAAETADQKAGKGKAAQPAGEGGKAAGQKPSGPQGKKGAKAPEAAAPGKGKGKGQGQQAQAFSKQLQHEQAKHMERQARLARIRELAVKKGDAEMIARVDKLIAQEQEVYARKQGKLQGQPRATPAPTGTKQAAPAPAGPNEMGAQQAPAAVPEPQGQPAETQEAEEAPAKPEEPKTP
jgi:hypothetical protein